MAQFLVYSMPRSRSFWLSNLLNAEGMSCGHDLVRFARTREDLESFFRQPFCGSVETAAVDFWRLQQRLAPETRIVIVRRDPLEVTKSVLRVAPYLPAGTVLLRMQRLDAKLAQAAKRIPGALALRAEELALRSNCAQVFEHCTGVVMPSAWYEAMQPLRLQINFSALQRYLVANAAQLARLRAALRQEELLHMQLTKRPVCTAFSVQQESLEEFLPDGLALMRENSVRSGRDAEHWQRVNWSMFAQTEAAGQLQITTLRSNGKLFGYLVAHLNASFEDTDLICCPHSSLYVSPLATGQGVKLFRSSVAALRAKLPEGKKMRIMLGAGKNGDGPRLGLVAKRLGFAPFAEFFASEWEN